MDRMRESVFAVLGDLTGRSFLDLFSGSGVIALEAASRGASPVEAVEADKGKAKTLLSNVSIAPAPIRCRFISAELYIKRAKRRFDVIFCDPPFSYQYKSDLIYSIGASPLMENTPEKDGDPALEETILIIHRPKSEQLMLSNEKSPLLIKETRCYGNSAVDFIEKSRARKLDC
jgi:16S rRNA (guanine(966)-N(2))-methyltransferase RsmD